MSEETDNPGRLDAQEYKVDPVNVDVPDASHHEHTKGVRAELLIVQQEIYDDIADNILPNLPTADQKAAMDGANAPAGPNPFATVQDITDSSDLDLKKANNLSDLADDATSRTNLDVYSKGEVDSSQGVQDTAIGLNTAKVTNVSTNLSTTATSTTRTVVSSDGTDAVLPAAVSSGDAGVMTGADKASLDLNTAKVTNVSTNLSTTQTATTVDVVSSDGTDATLPQAIASGNAGVLSGADKQKLDDLSTGVVVPYDQDRVTGVVVLTEGTATCSVTDADVAGNAVSFSLYVDELKKLDFFIPTGSTTIHWMSHEGRFQELSGSFLGTTTSGTFVTETTFAVGAQGFRITISSTDIIIAWKQAAGTTTQMAKAWVLKP